MVPLMTFVYGICLLFSVGIFIYMAQKNYNNMDAYYWTMIVLVPIVVMGYWLKTSVTEVESAKYLFCFIYLDSTFLIVVILFSMLQNLGIRIKPWMKIMAYGISAAHIVLIAVSVHNDLYYKTMDISYNVKFLGIELGNATKMVSGPYKVYHYVYLALIFIWLVVMLVMGIRKNRSYSKKSLFVYGTVLLIALYTHLLEGLIDIDFSMLPILYVIGEVILVLSYDYTHAHDVACVIVDRQDKTDTRGYVTISKKKEFLGCNERAVDFLPFLKYQRVDEQINAEDDDKEKKMVLNLIKKYEESGEQQQKYNVGNMTCVCEIMPFSNRKGGSKIGYMLDIKDVTEQQKYQENLESYLNKKIQDKTDNIKDIQRKVVLGMANMIENRDNNTGGHVKRTSDIIHIIVDEIIKQGRIKMSQDMATDIVRAAPTHDLGKISIDSNILNKPARLTDEEFRIMKTHATKSSEMVLILLDGVEEKRFVDVAYNVARYHHEKWNGTGYPDGLVGSMIPLEARIMAVADVYDALVSKRCYKEPMSFDQAYKIMLENMGTHFDPNMEAVFIGCRKELEEYYKHNS